MIADLHAHYAMHLVPEERVSLWRLICSGNALRPLTTYWRGNGGGG